MLSPHQTRLLHLTAQRLLPTTAKRPASPTQVVRDVFGLQAQDLPAALLSIRARSEGLTAAGVEQARQVDRSLVWTWCMRGTLHLVSAEDARWLIPLLGPTMIAADQRRFRQLGWDGARAVRGLRLLQDALVESGGLTRPEIIRLLQVNGLPSEGQAPIHLIARAAFESILCLGADRGNKPTYVSFESWLGAPQSLPRQEALAKLVQRYLTAYSPARPEDLASWSGLKLSDARQAWQLIADQLIQVEAAGQTSWLLKTQLPWLDEAFDADPVVNLLPRFDTYLLGYADRKLVVDPAYARRIHPGGGMISPVLLVDGQAIGTWKTRRRKANLEVVVTPFIRLAGTLSGRIEAEVADLGQFLAEETAFVVEDPGQV